MTKRLKYIISVSLVFIFLTPMTIKLIDSQFHHHDHFFCCAKTEHHFHKHHDKCPILDFESSLYSLTKTVVENQKLFYFDKLFINYVSIHCCNNSKCSFALRAPPLNIHI